MADLGDYLAFQLGVFLGALAITFLASQAFRRLFWWGQRWTIRSIGPNVAAFLFVPTLFGWAKARGGDPAWLATYCTYFLAALCMALIDVHRGRRLAARQADLDMSPQREGVCRD